MEKMRRDRINSCIEELKVLLEKEFHRQDPNAKLEKADVLEMTVMFLRRRLPSPGPAAQSAHSEGYSRCWKETLHFLSDNSLKEVTLPHLRYLQVAPRAGEDTRPPPPLSPHIQPPDKQRPGPVRAVWRPW